MANVDYDGKTRDELQQLLQQWNDSDSLLPAFEFAQISQAAYIRFIQETTTPTCSNCAGQALCSGS